MFLKTSLSILGGFSSLLIVPLEKKCSPWNINLTDVADLNRFELQLVNL